MITFTEDFKERMRKKLARYAEADKGRILGKVQVVINKFDNQLSEASVPGTSLKWFSDESGPSPLAYFLASIAMCQCVHYAEHASTEEIQLASLKITVQGTYTISHPRSFEEIDYTVHIDSPNDADKIRKLAETALNDCFVTNTLRKSCRVTGSLVLNGSQIDLFDGGASQPVGGGL